MTTTHKFPPQVTDNRYIPVNHHSNLMPPATPLYSPYAIPQQQPPTLHAKEAAGSLPQPFAPPPPLKIVTADQQALMPADHNKIVTPTVAYPTYFVYGQVSARYIGLSY